MRKAIILLLIFISCSMTGCTHETANSANMNPSPEVDSFAPLDVRSIDDFHRLVKEYKRSKTVDEALLYGDGASLGESYLLKLAEKTKLSDLDFYYQPVYLPEGYTCNMVSVLPHQVSLEYYSKDWTSEKYDSYSDSKKRELDFYGNHILFEFFRDVDDEKWLASYISSMNLIPLDENNIYYGTDVILSPDDKGNPSGKEILWIQDGYLMHMYLPTSIFESYQNNLSDILQGRCINILSEETISPDPSEKTSPES